MANDPYQTLGVSKTATADDIRKAYRKLVKENHPDLKPGDKEAEERFKVVQAAYDILGDADKRARYDRGDIDADGQERQEQQFYRHYADAAGGNPYHSSEGYSDFADMGDIFSDLFGQARAGGMGNGPGRGGAGKMRMRGGDARYTFEVDFLDAARGSKQRITMPDGRDLDLTIPAGFRDGQVLRLKGKGAPGFGGAPAGDALVTVHVRCHPLYRREGDDIHVELPVALHEAVLGGKVRVPTIDGPVTMTLKPGANTGDRLRLRGKGVATGKTGKRGDQHVTLKIVLPDDMDGDLTSFMQEWARTHAYNPRKGLEE